MSRLSRRMDEEVKWTPLGDRPLERWENPSIPSGYTYLLQFVAHDLVHSAIPLSIAGTLGAGTANARRAPLCKLLAETFDVGWAAGAIDEQNYIGRGL